MKKIFIKEENARDWREIICYMHAVIKLPFEKIIHLTARVVT
jgi:hypothetical protein